MTPIGRIVALSVLASAPAAWADDWVSVAKTGRIGLFVENVSVSRTGVVAAALTARPNTEAQPSAKKGKT